MTLLMVTGQWHFTSLLCKQILEKIRQMEEMFAVLLHYTQQEICIVVQAVGRFSAKVTHFMSVHSKVNCREYKISQSVSSICM